MKPKTFIIGIAVIVLAGFVIYFGWESKHGGKAHERACAYLKERIADAEHRMQEGQADLYSPEEIATIEHMFANIKAEGDCHRQYLKFRDHLKQHPMQGGKP